MTYRGGPERRRIPTKISVIALVAVASACSVEPQSNPASEIFPTQPLASEFTPVPTQGVLIEAGIAQDRNEILAGFGGAVGAGGNLTSRIEKVFNNATLQGSLNRNSLAPIIDSEGGITQIATSGDQRVCFPNMPEKLFNPNIPLPQEDNRIETNEFIISYGDVPTQEVRFQGLGAVALESTSQDLICVNAFVNSNINSFGVRDGVVLNVLMDRNNGDIYGTLPSIYGPNQNVRFDFSTSQVVVDNAVINYEGPRMAELTNSLEIDTSLTIESVLRFSRIQSGELTELFPRSEVYRTERGDVAIIDRANNMKLAGQVIETKYGTLTLLLDDTHYRSHVSELLSEKNVSEAINFSNYPGDWAENRKFREGMADVISEIASLQGYKSNSANIGGYPNMVENPFKDEIVRAMSVLTDLKERRVGFGSHLRNYVPEYQDHIVIFMNPGNATTLANALPDNSVDPASLKRLGNIEFGFPTFMSSNGEYVHAEFWNTGIKGPRDYPEVDIYRSFRFYIDLPLINLAEEVRDVYGLSNYKHYAGEFAPIYSNDILPYLDLHTHDFPTPFSWQNSLQMQEWIRFGLLDIVEVDFSKLR